MAPEILRQRTAAAGARTGRTHKAQRVGCDSLLLSASQSLT